MTFVKGSRMPVRKVRCLGCGCDLLRASHWRQARCGPCRKLSYQRTLNEKNRRLRQDARRYRIILHVLGWEPEQFAEMLEEMKRSPMMFRDVPETRLARLDLTLEKRSCG